MKITLWLEMLEELVKGDRQRAAEILRADLPLSLRSFSKTPTVGMVYQGVLPDKIRYFASGLPDGEREVLQSRLEDFTDYVLFLLPFQNPFVPTAKILSIKINRWKS